MLKFLKNAVTIISLVILTMIIIAGALKGTFNDPSNFYELMKESSKFNVSIAFGMGALVLACLIVQNKTELKANKDKYFNYFGIMFYFILLNIGVFYLSYFQRATANQIVLIVYFVLTMIIFAGLLFVTTRILGTIFNKKSL
jgi:hypothetical protein